MCYENVCSAWGEHPDAGLLPWSWEPSQGWGTGGVPPGCGQTAVSRKSSTLRVRDSVGGGDLTSDLSLRLSVCMFFCKMRVLIFFCLPYRTIKESCEMMRRGLCEPGFIWYFPFCHKTNNYFYKDDLQVCQIIWPKSRREVQADSRPHRCPSLNSRLKQVTREAGIPTPPCHTPTCPDPSQQRPRGRWFFLMSHLKTFLFYGFIEVQLIYDNYWRGKIWCIFFKL